MNKWICAALLPWLTTCTSAPKTVRLPTASPACPSQVVTPEHFSSGDIRRLASDDQVRSVEDMLSCLTRDLNLKTLLLHSSFAAQNSDSRNPRVLLLAGQKLDADGIFSVNSGEAHLNQAQSVELMFNNKQSGQVEFFDVDFATGRGVMSEANPQVCINCHGVDLRVPTGGPKLIFDRDPWPRVVHAGSNFSPQADTTGAGLCPQRLKLHGALEAQTLQAFASKPRYQSLTRLPRTDADDIDLLVRDLNSRRIARWIVESPDYQRFKWSIFAAAYYCIDKIESVLSPRQLKEMIQAESLSNWARTAGTRLELERLLAEKKKLRWKESLAIDEKNKNFAIALKKGEAVVLGLPNVDRGGQCTKPYDRTEDSTVRPAPLSLYDRYLADTEAEGGDLATGIFRFIFEARGLSIADWNTQPVPGYGRDPGMLLKYLMAFEPKDSPDYAILKEAVSQPQYLACPQLVQLAKQHFE